jgi:hypothetical protein
MTNSKLAWAIGLALASALPALPARAADDYPPGSENQWRFSVTPYIWLPGIYGDVTLRGITVKADASFSEIYNKTDTHFGVLGEGEAWKGDFGGFVNINYLNLAKNNNAVGPLTVDLSTQVLIFGFGLIYHVGDWYIGGPMDGGAGPTRRIRLEATAGGRYTSINGDLDVRGFPGRDKTQDWVDPVIGGRVIVDLTERVNAIIQADVGGTSTSNDFTWSATGLLGYRFDFFGLDAHALAGYRALAQNYSTTGSGGQPFRWNTTMRGPIVGMNVRF